MEHEKFKRYTHKEMAGFTHEQLSGNEGLIFIYDRTQADVDRVKYLNNRYLQGTITDAEREEWNRNVVCKYGLAYELGLIGTERGLIGALNLADIQRIEWNMKVIADMLDVSIVTKEWDYNSIPRVSDYRRIRENTNKLQKAWFILTQAPEVPTQPLNTYQKWNDIEKILHAIYKAYKAYLRSWYYCDMELYAGEGVGDI